MQQKIIMIEYIGLPKDRKGYDEPCSYGYANGDWTVVLPQSVMKKFFGLNDKEFMTETTFYSVLAINQRATQDEIKAAHRRLAKQWHPDVCQERGAKEQFQAIQKAYEILRDEKSRKKYDVGLEFSKSLEQQTKSLSSLLRDEQWRPPLRCGWLLVEGLQLPTAYRFGKNVSRFEVHDILSWEDIVQDGKTMISFWPNNRAATHFEVIWQ